jgi:hypothetical protein
MRTAPRHLSRRMRAIVEEFELLNLHDVDDRAYFRDMLLTLPQVPPMHHLRALSVADDETVTPGSVSSACAWLLYDNMGVDARTLCEIFELEGGSSGRPKGWACTGGV